MFVKQLIGRLAGAIVDMPYSAATSNISAGTCVEATDAEVAAAGLQVQPVAQTANPQILPVGYRAEATDGGGYDLFDAGGVRLNGAPLANMPTVLSYAHDYVGTTVAVITQIPLNQIPNLDGGHAFTLADYRFDPAEGGGFYLFDPAGVRLGEEAVADEDAAHLGLRQHYAASLGMTLDEFDAQEASRGLQTTIVVPPDWRTLHHTQKRALAQRISGEPVSNTAAAEDVIEEYLTRP